jgi:ABC-type glycerol-3-phosphate transport system permease component
MYSSLPFFLFPFYWQTITALKPPSELYAQPVVWFPSHLYWGHFQAVFTGFHFEQNIFNSVLVATVTTVLCLVLGTFAAYALAKLPLPAKKTILVLVVTMVTFPAIALVASLFLVLRSLGLIDTYQALIVPYVAFSLPFTIWVLTNFFRDIPGTWPSRRRWTAVPLAVAHTGDLAPLGAGSGHRGPACLHRRLE